MGSIGISNGGSMIKKLILTLALMGISGSICGLGAQKVAQASRFSWTAIKASMPTWGKAYTKAKQQGQTHYRPKSVNFRPLGAKIAGSAIASTSLGVTHAQVAPVEFNDENIDKYPEKKASFAIFACKNIATPENARAVNDNVVKGIVHFINTYPDQVPDLVKIARDKGCAVHKDIQQALACHDVTFKRTSYLSPGPLFDSVFGATTNAAMIQTLFSAIKIPSIDQKIIDSGCVECSPEYYAAWKIAGKNMRNELGKDIAQGVAVNMAQSIATQMINEKINDKKVSELIVKVATPLISNAYNKQFTLRNNTEAVLAVGIGETINAAGSKVADCLPTPAYDRNSYNNLFYYATNSAYWIGNTLPVKLVKSVAVAVASGVLAGKVCDKAFGPRSVATTGVSMKIGDY